MDGFHFFCFLRTNTEWQAVSFYFETSSTIPSSLSHLLFFPSPTSKIHELIFYLFWGYACKAPLKISLKVKAFSLPWAVMRVRGVVVADIWWRGPAAGACFHYLKALVCEGLREMWMKQTHKNSMLQMQPIPVQYFFLSFPSLEQELFWVIIIMFECF